MDLTLASFLEILKKHNENIDARFDRMQKEIDRLNAALVSKTSKRSGIRTYSRGSKNKELLNERNICHAKLWKNISVYFTLEDVSYIMTYDVVYLIQKFVMANDLPIATFENSNILYVYGYENEEWTIFTRSQLDDWLSEARHIILKQFLEWKSCKEREMASDTDEFVSDREKEKFMDRCLSCLQKIIGSNNKKENEFIYKWLCNIVKKYK